LIDFIESNGLDLTKDEKESIHEAQEDIATGRIENFVSAEEAKRQLGV
jgi:hypothetical protein